MAAVQPEECCLSVLAVAELLRGAGLLRAKGASAKARRIAAWIEHVEAEYAGRILGITEPAARTWGRLPHGRTLPDFDSPIGATALAHKLTVVTRNTQQFEPSGVNCLNPFTEPPG